MSLTTFVLAACCAACTGGDDTHDSGIVIASDARPDAPPGQEDCDTVNQDCLSPTSPKCTVVITMNAFGRTCLPETGMVGLGGTCLRVGSGNNGVGHDDCAIGLFCSGLGQPADQTGEALMRQCRAFCREDATCAPPQQCLAIGELNPQDGLCVETCTAFGADCTGGMWCRPGVTTADELRGTCATPGPVGLMGDCAVDQCQANMACLTTTMTMESSCYALCDIAGVEAPCTVAGQMCQGVNGLAPQVGVCSTP